MPKAWLSKSAAALRSQIDSAYPDRDKASDGWLGDVRHASRRSDHNPDVETGCVRAIDVDRDLTGKGGKPDLMPDFADQLRLYARDDKSRRISYIIFNGKIASSKRKWAWQAYKGINAHNHHMHVSFNPSADYDSTEFNIPMLGDK